jgi:hypothetical protein
MVIQWLTRFYSALLRLYPLNFRLEFGEEMQDSFSQALNDAGQKGGLAVGRLCLKELASLPGSIVLVRRQGSWARPGAARWASVHLAEHSWGELLLALAVFLLPAGMVLINHSPQGSSTSGLQAALLFLVVMMALGWLGGFPLWSVPYVGIVLVIAGYLHLFWWVAALVSPSLISNFTPGPWDRSTYLVLQVVSNGMLWLMLFCLTLLVVALLAVFNRFQLLLVRVRNDWTLLSYVLYGESVFALLLLESYRDEVNFAMTSLICLAAGIWFYLRSSSNWQRLLALLTCLTLAVGVTAVGKGEFSLGQVWASWVDLRPSQAGRLFLSWLWMVAALVLPGLLSLKQGRGDRQVR